MTKSQEILAANLSAVLIPADADSAEPGNDASSATLPATSNRELSIDEAEALGLDGTGRDGNPLHPFLLSDVLPCEEVACSHCFATHLGEC